VGDPNVSSYGAAWTNNLLDIEYHIIIIMGIVGPGVASDSPEGRTTSASAEIHDCPFTSEDVLGKARECLKMAPYPRVRNVSCEYRDGALVLRGQLPTFFQKQLAQEAVSRLDGVTQVVNQIEVVRN